MVELDEYGGSKFHRLAGVIKGRDRESPTTHTARLLKDGDVDRHPILLGEPAKMKCGGRPRGSRSYLALSR